MATLYHVNAVIKQIRKNNLYGLGHYHQQLRIECPCSPYDVSLLLFGDSISKTIVSITVN